MEIGKIDTSVPKIVMGLVVFSLVVWLVGFMVALAVGPAQASDVQWSRLKGTVKGINLKASTLTVLNPEGDWESLKIDDDVAIFMGKELRALKDVQLDDKVTLVYVPKAPKPKEEEVPFGGVYK